MKKAFRKVIKESPETSVSKQGFWVAPSPRLKLSVLLLQLQEKRDLITGLKKRAKYGRPDWDTVFNDLKKENKGPISVFYCGNPAVATILRQKCQEFGFKFHKEVF